MCISKNLAGLINIHLNFTIVVHVVLNYRSCVLCAWFMLSYILSMDILWDVDCRYGRLDIYVDKIIKKDIGLWSSVVWGWI